MKKLLYNLTFLIRGGLKSATVWSQIALLLRMGSGVLLLPLILRYISSEQLGLWYVFLSIGSASVMVDLGFSKTVIRSVAALWAGAPRLKNEGIEHALQKGKPNLDSLYKLARAMRTLYLLMALIVAGFLIVANFVGIPWPERTSITIKSPMVAWYFYAAGVIILSYNRWQPAFLSGVGRIRLAQQYTAIGSIVYLIAAGASLVSGLGLFGIAASQVLQAVVVRQLFTRSLRGLLPKGKAKSREVFEVLKILWPTTWRHGSMIFVGNLVNCVNMLVISNFVGLQQASSYGLSLQLITIVESLSGILLSVKLPEVTMTRVHGDADRLRYLVLPRIAAVFLLFIAGGVAIFFIAPYFLQIIDSQTHLLPVPILLLLITMRLLNFNQNQCIRVAVTANRLPFFIGFLSTMLIILPASWIGAKAAGVAGVLIINIIIQSIYSNWAIVLYTARDLGLSVTRFYSSAFISLGFMLRASRLTS